MRRMVRGMEVRFGEGWMRREVRGMEVRFG